MKNKTCISWPRLKWTTYSYFSAATPAQNDSFMDSELFEQIRAFEPEGLDDFDIYSNMSMK